MCKPWLLVDYTSQAVLASKCYGTPHFLHRTLPQDNLGGSVSRYTFKNSLSQYLGELNPRV